MNAQKNEKSRNLKHVRVYDQLYRMIQEGVYPPGTQLPSEPELASRMGVSRMTLRRALSLLIDDGLVKNIRGKGNFIRCQESLSDPDRHGLETLGNPVYFCCKDQPDSLEMEFRLEPPLQAHRRKLKAALRRRGHRRSLVQMPRAAGGLHALHPPHRGDLPAGNRSEPPGDAEGVSGDRHLQQSSAASDRLQRRQFQRPQIRSLKTKHLPSRTGNPIRKGRRHHRDQQTFYSPGAVPGQDLHLRDGLPTGSGQGIYLPIITLMMVSFVLFMPSLATRPTLAMVWSTASARIPSPPLKRWPRMHI